MRLSDEALLEGVNADMVPDGEDAIRALFDVVYGLVLIVIGIASLILPRRRRRRHRG